MEYLVSALFLLGAIKCFMEPGCAEAGLLLSMCFLILVAVQALYHIFKPPRGM